MSWSSDVADEAGTAIVKIRGREIEVKAGEPFAETIFKIAKDAGLGSFDVKLNGSVVGVREAPSVFKAGDVVELTYYGKLA